MKRFLRFGDKEWEIPHNMSANKYLDILSNQYVDFIGARVAPPKHITFDIEIQTATKK